MTIDKQKLQKLLWAEAASFRADCADWKRNTEALQEFLGEKTVEEVALELLAENERLKTLRSTTERDLAQELEVWKRGPSCWNCGDTGDVHDMVGEWRGQCDCNAAKVIDVSSECDRLKAENAGLQTGYEAYERVNAELKDENDALRAKRLPGAARAKKLVGIASSHRRDALALRKDLESHKRMLLATACDIGAIGKALKADMNADGDELLGTVIDLKAQNTRMLEWLKDISRTSGDKSAVMGARQLLKEFAE